MWIHKESSSLDVLKGLRHLKFKAVHLKEVRDNKWQALVQFPHCTVPTAPKMQKAVGVFFTVKNWSMLCFSVSKLKFHSPHFGIFFF